MTATESTSTSGNPIADRLFQHGKLSIGLTLPLLETGRIVADFGAQVALAKSADALGYRTGRRGLVDLLSKMRDSGTHHVALNLPSSERAPREVIEELAAEVLPEFHSP
jgi:hypothetical protein